MPKNIESPFKHPEHPLRLTIKKYLADNPESEFHSYIRGKFDDFLEVVGKAEQLSFVEYVLEEQGFNAIGDAKKALEFEREQWKNARAFWCKPILIIIS